MPKFSKIMAQDSGGGAWEGTNGTKSKVNSRNGIFQRSIDLVEARTGPAAIYTADGPTSSGPGETGAAGFLSGLFRRAQGQHRHSSIFNPKVAEYRSVVEEVSHAPPRTMSTL